MHVDRSEHGQSVPFTSLPTGSGDTYTFSFDPLILPGNYTLSANTAITDLAGNLIDQDQDGTGGEVGQDEPVDVFEVSGRRDKPIRDPICPTRTPGYRRHAIRD